MNSKTAILTGVSWTVTLNIVNGIYGFLSVPLLLFLYGKSHYGLIAIALSINLYLRLLDLGFNSTNVKFYSVWMAQGKLDKVKKLFQTSLGFYGLIGLLNAVVLVFIALFSDVIFNISSEESVILRHLILILAGCAFINWYSSSLNQVIMASEQVGWVQRMAVVPKLCQFLILLFVYVFSVPIEVYFLSTCLSVFIVIPFSIVKIKALLAGVSFLPCITNSILKEILPYCMNVFSFGIFQFSMDMLRPVFLGIRISPEAVAEYKIIGSIVTLATMLGGSFMSTVLPSVSKARATNNQNAILRIAYQGTKYISVTLSFCSFGLIVVADELLTVYVGASYLHLVPWLSLWLLVILFGHNQGISSIILAGNDIRALSYSSAVATALGLSVCWFLIPVWGIGGTVIGYLCYCLVQFVFYYFYYWRIKLGLDTLKIFVHSFLIPVLVSSFVCVLILLIQRYVRVSITHPITVVTVKGFIFTLLFAVLHYNITCTEEDRTWIANLLKK